MISKTISSFKYKLMGLMLIIISLLMFSLSGYLLLNKEQTIDRATEANKIINDCIEFSRKMTVNDSFIINRVRENNTNTNRISFTKYGLEEPIKDMATTSVIIKGCPKLELKEFCYGEECNISHALFMVLELK